MHKTKYNIMWITMVLPFIIVMTSIIFLPDQIPMHYNFGGEIDRYGSKYELLILPILCFAAGLIFYFSARYTDKKGLYKEEKICLISGIGSVFVLDLLLLIHVINSLLGQNSDGIIQTIDIYKWSAILIGILLCVVGCVLPMVRRNFILGLRTKWSMQSDDVWKASQKFGGIAIFISGLLTIISCTFLEGAFSILVCVGILSITLITCYFATRYIYRKSEHNKVDP